MSRLDGNLGDRIAKGIGSLTAKRRCRRDRYFMVCAALISERAWSEVELLMRECNRLRIAIGRPVLDPIARAARAHAATLACGRSPAWTKKRRDNSSESSWANRSHALSKVARDSPNRAGSLCDTRLSSSARSNDRKDCSKDRGLLTE